MAKKNKIAWRFRVGLTTLSLYKIFPAGRAHSRALRIPFEIINFFRGGPEVKQFVIFLKTFVRRKRKLENDILSAQRDGFSCFTMKKCIHILLLRSSFQSWPWSIYFEKKIGRQNRSNYCDLQLSRNQFKFTFVILFRRLVKIARFIIISLLYYLRFNYWKEFLGENLIWRLANCQTLRHSRDVTTDSYQYRSKLLSFDFFLIPKMFHEFKASKFSWCLFVWWPS